MKKIFTSILFVLYLTASSGATINFHYCMGEFIGIDVHAFSDNTCSNCGMAKEKKKGCCSEKHTTLQLKKDQLVSTPVSVPENNFVFINPTNFSEKYYTLYTLNNKSCAAHRPPLIQTVSASVMLCVFRI